MDPEEHAPAGPSELQPPRDEAPSDGRRKLLLGSLGGGSVLMSVMSRPVLGSTTCVAAYVATSVTANTSRNTTVASVCSGLTPTQWKARANQWPSPYSGAGYVSGANYVSTGSTLAGGTGGQQGTLFHCTTTGLNGRVFGDRTMLEVIDINEGGIGVGALGRYIVAALLNARAGRTPVLTETTVRVMWNSMVATGYYEPTPGVRWSPLELIAYLKTTMG